ncbi:MAG TPA: sulfotransferase domain-containing protein [Dongiaceae bacterium]|nr:sulfotransferase domain-containing protein [Dongiaceae bacterium]
MNQMTKLAWPRKRREMHNHHMDSTIWNDFRFRDDDVIIATYGKSGTTWTQQIVSQLIFNGAEGIDVSRLSPWVDLRIMPKEAIAGLEHQTHRRFLKTHLPVDALVFSPRAKYIYIGRDGRDAIWSLYNHHINATDQFFAAFNGTPGRHGPGLHRGAADVHAFYTRWFEGNGEPYWPFWENIRSWWGIGDLPNVLLLHFSDMKRDLAGSIRTVADFLEIEIDERVFPAIVEHCSFDYMKAHAETVAPLGGALWQGGARTFVNKGTNGRWQGTLSPAEIAAYEAKAEAELGLACARWLEFGEGC